MQLRFWLAPVRGADEGLRREHFGAVLRRRPRRRGSDASVPAAGLDFADALHLAWLAGDGVFDFRSSVGEGSAQKGAESGGRIAGAKLTMGAVGEIEGWRITP
jgi:hypothetical protein